MKNLVLVRHGPTDCTIAGRFCGRHDPALTSEGVRAAEMIALHPALDGPTVVVSSPSQRAMQTATAIAAFRRLPLLADEGLREIDFGDWEGRKRDEISTQTEYLRWEADPSRFAPPNGETGVAAQGRLVAAVSRHLVTHDSVVVVSHKGAIRLLISHFCSLPVEDFRRMPNIPAASVTQLKLARSNCEVVSLGDIKHLPGDFNLGAY